MKIHQLHIVLSIQKGLTMVIEFELNDALQYENIVYACIYEWE